METVMFSVMSPMSPDVSCDRLLAREMEKRDKEMRRLREQHEFELLRAQYGMDNEGNFREQSLTNMQRAVYSGELSVADYYERQIELRMAESSGVDDGSSCTKDIVPQVYSVSSSSANVAQTLMCTTVDHYASTYGDKGWGCGYRNMQMMLSSLLQHTGYNEQLYKQWAVGVRGETPSRSAMPSISRLQHHIEWAWHQGFDLQGCDQLGGKLSNTRKWIGATEVVTVLSSLRIRCQLVDFHRPTSANGSHPELFNWVRQYFEAHDDFKPPLYLQHQGHSRTIIGVEVLRDESVILLVLDPSHTPGQMAELRGTNTAISTMRLIRKSLMAMKARHYQVVAVCGIMDTDAEYQVTISSMQLIRKSLMAMKARHYQVVAVCGIMDTDAEYQVTISSMQLIRKSLMVMKARHYQVVAVCGIMDTDAEYQVTISSMQLIRKSLMAMKARHY
ncbi:hypothetical protein J6590_075543 [Homalodisca vitripennis]|nr:hypothetical protein J6590_075543 [Homalodisca vitripennis]